MRSHLHMPVVSSHFLDGLDRKSNNEIVPKRDITIADKTKKSVVVSLWNDHATNVGPSSKGGVRSMYYDRVSLSHVTSNPSLGEDKPSFFSIRAYISFIKPDQTMWYQACKTCNKKVTDAIESGYIMVVKVSDDSGEACLALFNEQAERIFGCSADELDKLKSQEGEENRFQQKLKEAIWVPHLFLISVAQHEYMNEKRQWITARAVVAVDFAAESRLLLEEISKMKTSQ
ncbi:Replication protein A 70 kDa DNA-binding subunit B [Vitis vinifera]|uniref:Replication protein A 70 kDa DNA-binding subunit B n=1 Tax=Vitis vinifera TaxID=29760 RepID=A0A438FAE6_VITVI|nr:Replication protein A 70 kDa DNA-binding subunit B [Vitis vinifera]